MHKSDKSGYDYRLITTGLYRLMTIGPYRLMTIGPFRLMTTSLPVFWVSM